MGFVATAEEIEHFRDAVAAFEPANDEALAVEFTTSQAFVRKVIPPCFDVPETPSGMAFTGRFRVAWRDKLLRYSEGSAGGIFLNVLYKGEPGIYAITLFMDNDFFMIRGRELYGWPGKAGQINTLARGQQMYGFVERGGIRLIEIDATLGDLTDPMNGKSRAYDMRASLCPGGSGLAGDPVVIIHEGQEDYRLVRRGTAKLMLRGTARDPVDTIPVESVGDAIYWSGGSRWAIRHEVQHGVDHATYLPHIVGRNFDAWSELIVEA
jgi:hypothetical protein